MIVPKRGVGMQRPSAREEFRRLSACGPREVSRSRHAPPKHGGVVLQGGLVYVSMVFAALRTADRGGASADRRPGRPGRRGRQRASLRAHRLVWPPAPASLGPAAAVRQPRTPTEPFSALWTAVAGDGERSPVNFASTPGTWPNVVAFRGKARRQNNRRRLRPRPQAKQLCRPPNLLAAELVWEAAQQVADDEVEAA